MIEAGGSHAVKRMAPGADGLHGVFPRSVGKLNLRGRLLRLCQEGGAEKSGAHQSEKRFRPHEDPPVRQ